MRIQASILVVLAACSVAVWTDTFGGQDTRTASTGALPPSDDSGASTGDAGTQYDAASSDCQALAASRAPVPITVTFPGYGTGSASIHVVTSSGSCDLVADTAQDGVVFTSNALPCASLLAPGSPSFAQATASGGAGPNDLTFQWGYDVAATCTITDEYSLAKQ
ncbi:MAG TPA: hypothetical protein VLM85_29540 [Polyangiaceae bacterium]|nr:hypothetical protein [Polyangiaceae bacterium]